MTETSWGEGEVAPRKKSIPTWLWFCGGGCLLAMIVAIAGGAFLYSKGKQFITEGQNPEVQWPRVAEFLPFDSRPEGVELKFGGGLFGQEAYTFRDNHGFVVILLHLGESAAKDREKALDPQTKGGVFGMGKRRDAVAATITVQGRTLKALRFQMEAKGADEQPAPTEATESHAGPTIMVDVTPEGSARPVFLQMTRLGGNEPVTDADVQRFLKPFHVGPDR